MNDNEFSQCLFFARNLDLKNAIDVVNCEAQEYIKNKNILRIRIRIYMRASAPYALY